MRLTVKQLAQLSGVSVRTLHHYDAIGLLAPAYIGENGYRYYERIELLRLQQILLYREMGVGLSQIAQIIDDPKFDAATALAAHRRKIVRQLGRYHQLIKTIDVTLLELRGAKVMTDNNPFEEANPFEGFSPERQAVYEKELVKKYGQQAQAKIDESIINAKKLSPEQVAAVKNEGHQVNLDLVKCLETGDQPASKDVQALIARHHGWVSLFWVPDRPSYIGLAQSYCDNADFKEFYDKYDQRLVDFLAQGMKIYAHETLT